MRANEFTLSSNVTKGSIDIDLLESNVGYIDPANIEFNGVNKKLFQYLSENNITDWDIVATNIILHKRHDQEDRELFENVSNNDATLINAFDQFNLFYTGNQANPGDYVCLVVMTAELYSTGHITVEGFTKPKELLEIRNTIPETFVFEDGQYPNLVTPLKQTRFWRQIIVFKNQVDCEKCVGWLSMLSGSINDWNINIQVSN